MEIFEDDDLFNPDELLTASSFQTGGGDSAREPLLRGGGPAGLHWSTDNLFDCQTTQVILYDLSNLQTVITLSGACSVKELKNMIAQTKDHPYKEVTLVLHGKRLFDESIVSDELEEQKQHDKIHWWFNAIHTASESGAASSSNVTSLSPSCKVLLAIGQSLLRQADENADRFKLLLAEAAEINRNTANKDLALRASMANEEKEEQEEQEDDNEVVPASGVQAPASSSDVTSLSPLRAWWRKAVTGDENIRVRDYILRDKSKRADAMPNRNTAKTDLAPRASMANEENEEKEEEEQEEQEEQEDDNEVVPASGVHAPASSSDVTSLSPFRKVRALWRKAVTGDENIRVRDYILRDKSKRPDGETMPNETVDDDPDDLPLVYRSPQFYQVADTITGQPRMHRGVKVILIGTTISLTIATTAFFALFAAGIATTSLGLGGMTAVVGSSTAVVGGGTGVATWKDPTENQIEQGTKATIRLEMAIEARVAEMAAR
jgi:hypothetical protein